MTKLLATSPFVNVGNGMSHKRVVLKGTYYGTDRVEYIVHDEYVNEVGTSAYGQGSYFPKSNTENNLISAWTCFHNRSCELMKRVFLEQATLSDLNSERFEGMNFTVPGKGGV